MFTYKGQCIVPISYFSIMGLLNFFLFDVFTHAFDKIVSSDDKKSKLRISNCGCTLTIMLSGMLFMLTNKRLLWSLLFLDTLSHSS